MLALWFLGSWLLLLMGMWKMTKAQMNGKDTQWDKGDMGREVVYPTGYLPPTATVPTYACDNSHRPMEDNIHQFQVYHNERWWTHNCPENLEWNQESCRCEYPDGDPANTHCRDYRDSSRGEPGKYEQYVNGAWIVRDCSLAVAGLVWEQRACQCVWGPGSSGKVTGQGITPCDIMLNMTFEDGVKDVAKGSFVEVEAGGSLHTTALGKDKNMAAHFQGTALNIWFFSNNELGSSLRVEFQFKMDDIPESRDKYQILLSNGCNVSVPGYTTPSLAIGYRPSDESYLLAFQTDSNRKAIACSLNLGAHDWHTVSLIYEDGVLFLRVDGQPCIVSQDFSGDVMTTACPLTIGADPLERQSMYHGYLDNIVIARYCRRYMDVTDKKDNKDPPMRVIREASGSDKSLKKQGNLSRMINARLNQGRSSNDLNKGRPQISPFMAKISRRGELSSRKLESRLNNLAVDIKHSEAMQVGQGDGKTEDDIDLNHRHYQEGGALNTTPSFENNGDSGNVQGAVYFTDRGPNVGDDRGVLLPAKTRLTRIDDTSNGRSNDDNKVYNIGRNNGGYGGDPGSNNIPRVGRGSRYRLGNGGATTEHQHSDNRFYFGVKNGRGRDKTRNENPGVFHSSDKYRIGDDSSGGIGNTRNGDIQGLIGISETKLVRNNENNGLYEKYGSHIINRKGGGYGSGDGNNNSHRSKESIFSSYPSPFTNENDRDAAAQYLDSKYNGMDDDSYTKYHFERNGNINDVNKMVGDENGDRDGGGDVQKRKSVTKRQAIRDYDSVGGYTTNVGNGLNDYNGEYGNYDFYNNIHQGNGGAFNGRGFDFGRDSGRTSGEYRLGINQYRDGNVINRKKGFGGTGYSGDVKEFLNPGIANKVRNSGDGRGGIEVENTGVVRAGRNGASNRNGVHGVYRDNWGFTRGRDNGLGNEGSLSGQNYRDGSTSRENSGVYYNAGNGNNRVVNGFGDYVSGSDNRGDRRDGRFVNVVDNSYERGMYGYGRNDVDDDARVLDRYVGNNVGYKSERGRNFDNDASYNENRDYGDDYNNNGGLEDTNNGSYDEDNDDVDDDNNDTYRWNEENEDVDEYDTDYREEDEEEAENENDYDGDEYINGNSNDTGDITVYNLERKVLNDLNVSQDVNSLNNTDSNIPRRNANIVERPTSEVSNSEQPGTGENLEIVY